MKKIHGIFLAGVMALSLGGVLALAMPDEVKEVKADEADVLQFAGANAGINVIANTSKLPTNVSLSESSSAYTLTFNGYTYNNDPYYDTDHYDVAYGMRYEGKKDLIIVLNGNNSVTLNSHSSTYCYGFYIKRRDSSNNKLIFKGNGSLTVKGPTSTNAGQVYGLTSELTTYIEEENGTTNPTVKFTSGNTEDNGYASGGYCRGIYMKAPLYINRGTIEGYGGTCSIDHDYGAWNASIGLHCYNGYIQNGGTAKFVGNTGNRVSSSIGVVFANDEYYFNGGTASFIGGTVNGTGKSLGVYGFAKEYSNPTTQLNVSDDFKELNITGNSAAVGLNVKDDQPSLGGVNIKNAQDGYGWTNTAGTTGKTLIETTTTPKSVSGSLKKVRIGGVPKVTATGYNGAYDGAEHTISVTVTKPSTGATIKYGTTSGTYNLDAAPTYKNVGTYTVYYQVTATGFDTVTGSANVVIGKADFVNASVTLTGDAPIYDGNAHTPTVTATAETVDGCDYAFSYSTSQSGTYGEMPSFTEAGEYTVYWKAVAANHNDATGSFTFIICRVYTTQPSVTLTSEPFTYDGTAKTPTVSTAGETGDLTPITFTYSTSETGTYSTSLPSFTNAGEHTVYWKAEADGYETVTGSFTVTISKAESSFTSEPTAVSGLLYNGKNQALVNAGTSETGTVMYRVGEQGDFSSSVPTAKDVGENKVYYYVKGDANHSDTQVKYVNVSIAGNDKALLSSAISTGNDLYGIVADRYPEIAGTLKTAIDQAKAVFDNPNVTVEQIQKAINDLNAAMVAAVTAIIDSIENVTLNSGEEIRVAKEAYDTLPEAEKATIPQEHDKLVEKETIYVTLVTDHNTKVAVGVIFGILGGLILLVCGAWALMMFVFNKWIKKNGKAVRVFKFGNKQGKVRVLVFPCTFDYRFSEEIFDTKEDALNN